MPHKDEKYKIWDKSAWKKFRKRIGANIHACRKAQGLSLEEFSEKSGYSVALILRVEQGKGFFDLPLIFHMTQALKVPTEVIFRSENLQTRPEG